MFTRQRIPWANRRHTVRSGHRPPGWSCPCESAPRNRPVRWSHSRSPARCPGSCARRNPATSPDRTAAWRWARQIPGRRSDWGRASHWPARWFWQRAGSRRRWMRPRCCVGRSRLRWWRGGPRRGRCSARSLDRIWLKLSTQNKNVNQTNERANRWMKFKFWVDGGVAAMLYAGILSCVWATFFLCKNKEVFCGDWFFCLFKVENEAAHLRVPQDPSGRRPFSWRVSPLYCRRRWPAIRGCSPRQSGWPRQAPTWSRNGIRCSV